MKKLRVLIVGENTSTEYGGEAILPLHFFSMLPNEHVETYLLTHARVRKTVQKMHTLDQSHIFYVPDLALFRWLHQLGQHQSHRFQMVTTGAVAYLINLCFQWYFTRKIVKQKNIDVVHQVTPVSPRLPSSLLNVGAPVVIGPMNGGMDFPHAFKYMDSSVETFFYKSFRVLSTFFNVLLPGKLFAKCLLVANERSKQALPKMYAGEVQYLVENGVLTTIDHVTPKLHGHINVLFVGRLVDWKTVDVLIEAFSLCQQTNIRLTIVGDGPESEALKAYSKQLNLQHVIFSGFVPFDEVNEYYDTADIFVLPSVRECGGAVVLEAMSRGLPVIATDWGGPADYIEKGTGFLVAPKSRQAMVQGFHQYIELLAADDALRLQMGEAGLAHVKKHFLWASKIHKVIDLYTKLV